MHEQTSPVSSCAWISGRETSAESFDYGEVVVPEVNIWNRPGHPGPDTRTVGKLSHGTRVNVGERVWDEQDRVHWYHVTGNGVEGWVKGTFLLSRWSRFTFLGMVKPSQPCMDLDTELRFRGMHLLLKQASYAIVTEGSPSAFDGIRSASSRLIERLLASLAATTGQPLRAEPINWVESPLGPRGELGTVGFTASEDKVWDVTDRDIMIASTAVPLMASVPYLDLAISDYYLAVLHPQHALIFLARAIESIENHFREIAKRREDAGKGKVMREQLELNKSDVDYVKKRANASHRRHATPDGRATRLPGEELAECFERTAKILTAFVDFLESCGF